MAEVLPTFIFDPPLRSGTVVSRPNRFIMFVKTGRRTLRCHCPTTGRIGDLRLEGLRCLYSTSHKPGRKTPYTVEAISPGGGRWIGINQTASNRYFEFFLRSGELPKLAVGEVRREVPLGRSRIDFMVGNKYIEVKTPLITLPAARGVQRVTRSRFDSFDRLIKHMGELRKSLWKGAKAAIVLCYLYDAAPFNPPLRNKTNSRILLAASRAEKAGVERWQVNLRVTAKGVSLIRYFRSRPYSSAKQTV